ncbi:Oligosaccharide biosynthesis protein Alg14-like protein [Kalmanozyma brasiliensis GHG001]|uniref:UDP-N-acetylglucosamine transferase subunit ALG14 n=1 Tax=Kalmanozyma brasiliensis (strain GHG001) TaxID=1365824 RepID=V5EZA8_KALBG|nr:Oligosaccharide biosynthesis protein Alg14-like protein [Kalmanozyma brasiliensis GHG001]EST09223.1 Oligosaccharide biosynthesis protein Alg14-like protein [Kalmanozyma brasiliensis GHG001]
MDRLAERYEAGKLYIQRPINEILPPSLLLYLIPPLPPLRYIAITFLLGCLLLLRVWWVLPIRKGRKQQQTDLKKTASDKCTVGVFLGSGGHTTELLQLVSALPTDRYTRRIYLVSSGDRFSLEKANELERKLSSSTASSDKPQPSPASKVIRIPRAREVHQSFLTTPFSLTRSIAFCIDHVALRPLVRSQTDGVLADVILMNGPGTCVPIVAAVYLLRILGRRSPKLVYVESFARVKSFSLTAKLIRPFVDRFILQWPRDASKVTQEARAKATSNTFYSGWLV